ncbi:MAG: hypothetical protein WEC14_00490 [Chloroflexota bacterium]
MTPRLVGGIAVTTLAIGVLIGAAGTVVVRDATTTDLARHLGDMTASAGSMGSMAGMAGMMSMMGGGSPMGPNALMTPGDHESHHATPSPAATR